MERIIRRVELLAFRQTTLYRVLEYLIEAQADFLATGDPSRRIPLTQREVAGRLNIAPSVLNKLIANKSVELPWSLEAPLKTMLPSRKAVMRERLCDLALKLPEAGDDTLREELKKLAGASLSRTTIIQYRKELGLGCAGHRGRESLRR